jgi:hypothetical protein
VNETLRRTWPLAAVWTVWKLSPAAGEVAPGWSVMLTSLFGSAPWSPLPLTVEVSPRAERHDHRLAGRWANGVREQCFMNYSS